MAQHTNRVSPHRQGLKVIEAPTLSKSFQEQAIPMPDVHRRKIVAGSAHKGFDPSAKCESHTDTKPCTDAQFFHALASSDAQGTMLSKDW